MTNMQLRLTSLFSVLFAVFITQAQQLDPIHYPPESEWAYLKTKATDSLIQVMKFYFVSDDTLFFREAVSQSVVKVAKNDLQTPDFYLGSSYNFANRFYGPGGEMASRNSKNEKLDRFFYYYLNASELRFSKEAPQKEAPQNEVLQEAKTEVAQIPDHQQRKPPLTSNYSVLQPHIQMKNGCVIVPEKFYFLSDGQLYYGNGIKNNVYKIDTTDIAAVIGIEVGKNLHLSTKTGYAFSGRILCATAYIVGLINTVGIYTASEYYWGDATLATLAIIPSGVFYIKLILIGTERINNKKRLKFARYVTCN
jgi:hypothetical protein